MAGSRGEGWRGPSRAIFFTRLFWFLKGGASRAPARPEPGGGGKISAQAFEQGLEGHGGEAFQARKSFMVTQEEDQAAGAMEGPQTRVASGGGGAAVPDVGRVRHGQTPAGFSQAKA